ncbi:MAG: tetratricopeptide repeat protein [Planctomycetota bacterium]
MSGSNTSIRRPAALAALLLTGLAASFGAFLTFLRFGVAPLSARTAVGLAVASVLAGCSLGLAARATGRLRLFVLVPAAPLLWGWWAFMQPAGAPLLAGVVAVAGFALLAGLAAPLCRSSLERASILAGAVLGAAACSAGLPAVMGLGPALVVVVLAAAALSARAGHGVRLPEVAARPPGRRASELLLAAAIGVSGVVVLRAYLPAVASLPYAAADLAVAAALGALAVGLVGSARGDGPLVAGAVTVLFVTLLAAFSFFLYPDVILSESAAAQTPARLLVAGRVFPMWVLAFCVGGSCGLLLPLRRDRVGAGAPLMAMAAGAAAAALLGGSYRAAPVLSCVLLLLALLPLCLAGLRTRGISGTTLRLAAALLVVGGLAWASLADPHLGCVGLRASLAGFRAEHMRAPARFQQVSDLASFLKSAAPGHKGAAPQSWSEMRERAGLRLEGGAFRWSLAIEGVRLEFLNGSLAHFEGEGASPEAPAPALSVALALAHSARAGRVALMSPALEVTAGTAHLLAKGAEVSEMDPWWPPAGEGYDVIVCGPGGLSGGGDPLRLISREGLGRVREHLAEGGVFSLWFPVGLVEVETLRAALAALEEVFPAYAVYVTGSEAVFVAGGSPELSYERLKRLQAPLIRYGFWQPLDLVAGFAADAQELGYLSRGATPFALSHPGRPPVLARDLLAPRRAASLAVLLQHRLSGPDRLARRIRFRTENQRAVALRGFGDTYRQVSRLALAELGLAGKAERKRLRDFAAGPLARLDLFAPRADGRPVRVAAALSALGLRDEAADALQAAIDAGGASFSMHYRLAGVLEGLDRQDEALHHYRMALQYEPDSTAARGRIAALLLLGRQSGQAAEVLEEIVEREPRNVTALLMLARLYVEPLDRPREAARLAVRVLRIDPDNAVARDLLALLGGAGEGEEVP